METTTNSAIREELKPTVKARLGALINDTGAIRNSTIKAELTAVTEYLASLRLFEL